MNHTHIRPDDSFRQTMSGLWSPSRSMTVAIFQDRSVTAFGSRNTALFKFGPCMYHKLRTPEVRFCQTRSGCPSPSKSAAPTRLHAVSTVLGFSHAAARMVLPCMYQITVNPDC